MKFSILPGVILKWLRERHWLAAGFSWVYCSDARGQVLARSLGRTPVIIVKGDLGWVVSIYSYFKLEFSGEKWNGISTL